MNRTRFVVELDGINNIYYGMRGLRTLYRSASGVYDVAPLGTKLTRVEYAKFLWEKIKACGYRGTLFIYREPRNLNRNHSKFIAKLRERNVARIFKPVKKAKKALVNIHGRRVVPMPPLDLEDWE